jgi:ssDNA-binding Zn-finger/Zn-ribbon topoisomerase 1
MGIVIRLTCPKCKLESGTLHIGKGSDIGQCYGVAWCPQCKEFTTPLVLNELYKESVNDDNNLTTIFLLDDRSIACPPDYLSTKFCSRCLSCCQEVSLFDMENKPCPICGTKMTETTIGIWKSSFEK